MLTHNNKVHFIITVFSPLIDDINTLEERGISVDFENENCLLKGTVCSVIGDNLGSHIIGGFSQNFGTGTQFCRYCTVQRNSFQENPLVFGDKRTVELYDSAVEEIERNQDQVVISGIKFRSLFNSLKYFHVCQPGLPPCIGHDLFEGVVSSDLALYIKYFVKTKRWFTYEQLNSVLAQFKFLGNDTNNKPNDVNVTCDKIGGHAVQNWCLLRLIPLLVGDRIRDYTDEVWRLTLLLREIVELICAPQIEKGTVVYMNVLIEDYLQSRQDAFPVVTLKPKHHFLHHYPALTLQFGPLIRVWMLRFESKHSYFKRCARMLHNFKNICSTLAERHQLLQAYLGAGSLFPPVLQVDNATPFVSSTYSDTIQEATSGFDFDLNETYESCSVTYKGSNYRKGLYVVAYADQSKLVFGRIVVILVKDPHVYIVTENFLSVFLSDLGVYALNNKNPTFACVNADSLCDYYPFAAYQFKGEVVLHVPLHHAILRR